MGIRDEQHWLSLVDGFAEAAVLGGEDQALWYAALAKLADATGSSRGELIGIGDQAAFAFNLLQDFPDHARREFFEIGAYSPSINPRVAVGMNAKVLQTVSEADCEAVRPLLRDEVFFDWAERHDIPFGCQTTLLNEPGRLIGMAMLRSRRDGPTSADDLRAFAAISSHVRSAVKMRLLLDDQAERLVAGTLDALTVAGFICDRHGRVLACSEPALALMRSTALLEVRQGRLTSSGSANCETLEAAIGRAARGPVPGDASPCSTIVLRHQSDTAAPLMLDVLSLPAKTSVFSPMSKVMVTARGPRDADDTAGMLQAGYGLTPAEAFVALEVARGRSRDSVAGLRGVSVGTVRIQLKSIFQKLRIRRETELAALLAPLI